MFKFKIVFMNFNKKKWDGSVAVKMTTLFRFKNYGLYIVWE
jgi:hypothetical protein